MIKVSYPELQPHGFGEELDRGYLILKWMQHFRQPTKNPPARKIGVVHLEDCAVEIDLDTGENWAQKPHKPKLYVVKDQD